MVWVQYSSLHWFCYRGLDWTTGFSLGVVLQGKKARLVLQSSLKGRLQSACSTMALQYCCGFGATPTVARTPA